MKRRTVMFHWFLLMILPSGLVSEDRDFTVRYDKVKVGFIIKGLKDWKEHTKPLPKVIALDLGWDLELISHPALQDRNQSELPIRFETFEPVPQWNGVDPELLPANRYVDQSLHQR